MAPFPQRVTGCYLVRMGRSGTDWSLVKDFQRGHLIEESDAGIIQSCPQVSLLNQLLEKPLLS